LYVQGRLVRPPTDEENFQIFNLLRDGLPAEEREEFSLLSTKDDIPSSSSLSSAEQEANAAHFREWRRDLARLGINFRQGYG
jgi:hypothetical protein